MSRELNKIFGTNRKGARKIIDKFDISKEDKNKVLDNLENSSQSNGGGNNITYYKVNLDNASDDNFHMVKILACMVAAEIKAIYGESGYGFSNFLIAPGGYAINNAKDNFKPLAIGVPSYIKIVTGLLDDNDNFTDKDSIILEGTLKEVIDVMDKGFGLSFNLFDYLEPITEEEFYNIKDTE